MSFRFRRRALLLAGREPWLDFLSTRWGFAMAGNVPGGNLITWRATAAARRGVLPRTTELYAIKKRDVGLVLVNVAPALRDGDDDRRRRLQASATECRSYFGDLRRQAMSASTPVAAPKLSASQSHQSKSRPV